MTQEEVKNRISQIRKKNINSIDKFRPLFPKVSEAKQPVVFNLISELHLDNKNMFENAHTRVLAAILRYDNRFLESFLERCGIKHSHIRINGEINVDVERQYTKKGDRWIRSASRIEKESTNNCRPDCLVWKEDQFAIIIENKINGAPETKHQVDNYIQAISGGNDIKLKDNYYIWVIYLGGDTEDMPSSESLSDAGSLFVRGEDENRRAGKHLSLVSYKNVVIPWLEEDVLPICPYGMTSLTGGLLVYIDYLKKRFEDSSSEEKTYYDSKDVVGFFRRVEGETDTPLYKLYNDAKDYVSIVDESDEDAIYFKALKHYYLNHHFRFKDQSLYKTWTISAAGSLVYVWKNSWSAIQVKSHSICDLFLELYPYQIDTYQSDPAKFERSKKTITISLKYKGKDERLKKSLEEGGITIGDHVFNKAAQKRGDKINLGQEGFFFDSFVNDPTIKELCKKIDNLLKKYKEESFT